MGVASLWWCGDVTIIFSLQPPEFPAHNAPSHSSEGLFMLFPFTGPPLLSDPHSLPFLLPALIHPPWVTLKEASLTPQVGFGPILWAPVHLTRWGDTLATRCLCVPLIWLPGPLWLQSLTLSECLTKWSSFARHRFAIYFRFLVSKSFSRKSRSSTITTLGPVLFYSLIGLERWLINSMFWK